MFKNIYYEFLLLQDFLTGRYLNIDREKAQVRQTKHLTIYSYFVT